MNTLSTATSFRALMEHIVEGILSDVPDEGAFVGGGL